ncbi:uncharacterized protein LOC100185693 [Ciona intestinalis]
MASKVSHKEAHFLEMKKAIILHLMALGFDSRKMENKYSCRLDENMFDKPNKRAFEVVFYFLFCKLDSSQAEQLFRLCFPGIDKQATLEFRKRTFAWLKRIAEENPKCGLKVSSTLLMSPGGWEFVHFVFLFTQFVLLKLCRSKISSEGSLQTLILSKNKRLAQVQNKVLQARSINIHKEIVKDVRVFSRGDNDIHNSFQHLLNTYHELQQEKAAATKAILKYKKSLKLDTKKQEELKANQQRLNKGIKQLRGMWGKVTSAVSDTRNSSEILASVIEDKNHKLEAEKLTLQVPSRLVNEYTEEIYQTVGSSLIQSGKINLLSVGSITTFSFMSMRDQLHKYGLPNFETQVPFLKIQAELHQEQFAKLCDIKSEAISVIKSAEKNISNLEEMLDAKYKLHSYSSDFSSVTDLQSDETDASNITSSLSNQTDSFESTDDSGTSLALKYLVPAGVNLDDFLQDIVSEPPISPCNPAMPTSVNITSPDITVPQTQPISQKKIKTASKLKPPSSKSSHTQPVSKSPYAKPPLVQGIQTDRASNRLSIGRRVGASYTPDRHGASVKQGRIKSLKQKGRKSMSLPSSPLVARSVGKTSETTVNEEIPSETPTWEKHLIDRIVNQTISDDLISPLFVYNQDELDQSAFVSVDKLPRTPTESFSKSTTDICEDTNAGMEAGGSTDKLLENISSHTYDEELNNLEVSGTNHLTHESENLLLNDEKLNHSDVTETNQLQTGQLMTETDKSAYDSEEKSIDEESLYPDSIEEEKNLARNSPTPQHTLPVFKTAEFNLESEYEHFVNSSVSSCEDSSPKCPENDIFSNWDTAGSANILDVSNLSLVDLEDSPEDQKVGVCNLIDLDETIGDSKSEMAETISSNLPASTLNLIDLLMDDAPQQENLASILPCNTLENDLFDSAAAPTSQTLQEVQTQNKFEQSALDSPFEHEQLSSNVPLDMLGSTVTPPRPTLREVPLNLLPTTDLLIGCETPDFERYQSVLKRRK